MNILLIILGYILILGSAVLLLEPWTLCDECRGWGCDHCKHTGRRP